MPDIAVLWNIADGRGDWAMAGLQVRTGQDLETAVLVSLFTDRAAQPGDVIPDASSNRRGWWGDATLGSRLWLLERAKKTDDIPARARAYIVEALQWLIDDGVAAGVDATVQWQNAPTPAQGLLAARIVITQPDGSQAALAYQWVWQGIG